MPAKSKTKTKPVAEIAATVPTVSAESLTRPAATDEARWAFETKKAEIAALDAASVIPLNLDIPRSVAVGLGVCSNLTAYHERLAQLPEYGHAQVKDLRTYALAALHAHLVLAPVKGNVDALIEEATQLKQTMLLGADALADKKVLDAARIAQIRVGSGYVDLASDCVALGGLFEERWSDIVGKTAITKEEVDRASVLGTALLEALGTRQAAIPSPDASDRRQRAFSLFFKVYDEASRGIAFLRWKQDDVEDIVPSLYQKTRRARRSAAASQGDNGGGVDAPVTPPVAPAAPAPVIAPANGGPVAGGGGT